MLGKGWLLTASPFSPKLEADTQGQLQVLLVVFESVMS